MDSPTLAMGAVSAPGIVAAVVTYRRPRELEKLLVCLSRSELPLLGVVISDHSPGGETRELAKGASIAVEVLDDPANPGPGAGWANAAKRGLELFPAARMVWFLDDDVVFSENTLGILWEDLTKAKAQAIAPLLEDDRGMLWGFPEPTGVPLRQLIRDAKTPQDALKLIGPEPHEFCWCTGASFLVSRGAIERHGYQRRDFWILGEDLEYSMRIAYAEKAVFTCRAVVQHLPIPSTNLEATKRGGYVKFCSLLQNLSYLSFHAKHSRHMIRYLPGNFRRFLTSYGWSVRTVKDAWTCLWHGMRGEPAGGPHAAALRQRISTYQLN